MVKPIQRSEIQGFSKGLVTDLNPLNGQIDTTVDERNFELHLDGTRSRRLGLDREVDGFTYTSGKSWNDLRLSATSTYLWEGAGGDPSNRFIVLQIGPTLYIFESGAGNSGETILRFSLDLGISWNAKVGFGHIEGYLGIVTGTPDIGLLSYDSDEGVFSYSTLRLKIRDQFGIQETITPLYEVDKSYRGQLNWQHYYNLYNQGWAIPRKDWSYGDPPAVDAVYLGANKQTPNNSPSNADVVWTGMDRKPVQETSLENFDAFHYRQFEAVTGSDTIAAKGFFIIDAFNRGSSRYEAWIMHKNKYPQTGNLVGGLNPPADVSTGGPTSVAAHAGRLFYSGCKGTVVQGDERSPNYNNYVFFTQLIKSRQEFGKCYQEGDPSSNASSDVLDTDGGFFTVSEAINIHTMYSMGDRLFLVAENGVWSVTGGSGYGFAATNYKVEKLSTYGGIPNRSFVEYGGNGYFWGWDGIYAVARNQYGDYTVENISRGVIDRFYIKLDDTARVTCQGFVDKARRQVRWVYTEGNLFVDAISHELVLDLKFNAFYPFTIAQHPLNTSFVLSGIQLGDFTTEYTEDIIVAGTDPVLVGSDQLITSVSQNVALDSNVRYFTATNIDGNLMLSICQYRDPLFRDWMFTGVPADAYAYMETNAFTGGDFAINKQLPYVTIAFADTEKSIDVEGNLSIESSCIGRFMWNFSNQVRSGKWSRPMQLYRKSRFYFGDVDISTGFAINITKTKVRGTGKAFALRVETEPLKDCHIFGWSMSLTGNTVT